MDPWDRERRRTVDMVEAAKVQLDRLRAAPTLVGRLYVDQHLEEATIALATARIQIRYAQLARSRFDD